MFSIIYSKLLFILSKWLAFFMIFLVINILFLNKKPKNKNIYKVGVFKLDKIFLNISSINYIFSFKYNITKVEYNISIYDNNHNIILPSYLVLYYKIHIFCYNRDIKNDISIIYIANIYENNYFSCIEYIYNKEEIQFGISIYKKYKYIEFYNITIFNSNLIEYNNYNKKKDEEFDPLIQINSHSSKIIIKNDSKVINSNKLFRLKQSFYLKPNFNIKKNLAQIEEYWYFKNIYNQYFCFCKYSLNSKCLYKTINQKYKYYLFLYFIDINRDIYNKTEYLFADFSSEHTSTGEAYLVFKEMLNQNLSVHYLTKREDIYKEYISLKRNNCSYTPIIFDSNFINGNFLEKYFDLILRLKVVVSGAKIFSISNLFYNIEYITYICLTHGISYIKDFLYKNYYSRDFYDKIVLPPSNLIISNAKKYGWKDCDIIRIGLPRWDLLNDFEKNKSIFSEKENNRDKSIFVMFTWRDLKENQKISKYYFKNIINLINNEILNSVLQKKNITLYYSLHHMISEYKYVFNNNKFSKYIDQEQIIDRLIKSDLIITDFSSIVFDIMVRNKPYIIFIPDSEDKYLDNIYNEAYCNIIKSIRNGTIYLKNRYFDVNTTVKKIIYYINNNFILEKSLKIFYNKFNLSGGNNINSFINYLKNIF